MIKMLWGVVDFSTVPRVQLKEANRVSICSPKRLTLFPCSKHKKYFPFGERAPQSEQQYSHFYEN